MSIFVAEYYIRKYLTLAMVEIKDDPDKFADLIYASLPAIGDFDIKAEFKRIFAGDTPFKIKFGLNVDSENLPAVHVYLPAESSEPNMIGSDPEYDGDDGDVDTHKVFEINNFRFQTKYTLMIIDKNADSVLILYHTLKYMLLRYSILFENDGFQNLQISGNDLITEQNLIPMTIYSRNLMINFTYENETQNVYYYETGSSLKVDPKIEFLLKSIIG